MSIYDDGKTVYLAALNTPMYDRKIKEYEDKGYQLIPQSHTIDGYCHKWRMNLVQEPITPEQELPRVYEIPDDIAEIILSDEPIEISQEMKDEFLPDWDKVNEMYDESDKTRSKQKLRDYAANFGVTLNVRTTFAKMKKMFSDSATQV